MFIGVEDGSMSTVVSLWIPVLVFLSVIAHKICGYIALINSAVAFVFPGVTSVLPIRFLLGLLYLFSNNLD